MSVLPAILRGHGHRRPVLWARRSTGGVHRRKRREPRAIRESALIGNERPLARAKSSADAAVLGSDRALYVADESGGWRRIGWADIASVTGSHVSTALTLRLWPGDDRANREVRLQTDAVFASFVSERVAATRVLRRQVPIRGSSAIVTAVRAPGQEEVMWRVQLAAGCDGNDADIRLAVRRAIVELRSVAGC